MTPTTEELSYKTNTSPLILIDSQTIQFSADKNRSKSQAFLDLFEQLKKQGYELGISEITVAENLHGLYGKSRMASYAHLSQFIKKIISENVLSSAAEIGGLYRDEGYQIGLIDKIIAATAFLEKGFILTNNHKDFPSPFFESVEYFPVRFQISGKYPGTTDIVLYKMRYDLITRRIEEKVRANS
ncbi:hypothetical protein A3B56_03140 [Candidatus Roizmanbacteria bacterium RIFCSPLOWO2_01_FULL_45_11]|uniref:PIN domain-containing protein n=1 Tax=Candidatus Roizmanbacteria bacterium RIFCSPLOWO2_01_FULL_45_11 TaxID=1802070 RepID=A0A1F7JHJ1_9BACT|nr:MAG: hypothetical protein A3B56_03140 [Candidatus Roizmanbacteria bacterium RIFCSPLOWO2_01_FULL_45_11]